jgi:glycosyltransferase involved in cell wall biosynthesis
LLEGATILVFADDWGLHPSSAQHLFRRFLGRNRVVWIETVGLRLPRLTARDARKVLRKIGAWSGFARGEGGANGGARPDAAAAAPRPEVRDLPLLPLPLGRAARAANARLLRRAVRAAAADDETPFLVTTLPLTADLLGALPGATFVYYLVDDYASWPGLGGRLVRRMDEEQARGADLIVAASQALAAMHAPRARRSPAYLPHGVEVAHFARARALREARRQRGEPPLADAVYFGAVDERLDAALLAALAAARPGRRFLVVGPGEAPLAPAPNLARRPALAYADLPDLLAACDAAILPYTGGPLGERLSPLKAREALAAGLPVVGTDVPELRTLGRGVRLGTGAEALAAALDAALAGAAEDVPPLEDLARDTWEARAERLSELLLHARAARAAP